MQNFTLVDGAIIAIVLISLIMGIWRGLFREMMSLLVWILAIVIAVLFSPSIQHYFSTTTTKPEVQLGIGFLVLFMAAYLIGMFVRYWFIKCLSPDVTISGRIWGGLFGLIRGILFVVVGGFLVAFTTLTSQPIWQQAVLVPVVLKADTLVAEALPNNAGATVMNLFGSAGVALSKTKSNHPINKTNAVTDQAL